MTRNPWLIVSGDFVRTGGQDRANFALASYLAREGFDVHLVAHRVDDELAAHANVTVHPAAKPLRSDLLGEPFRHRLGTRWATELAPRDPRVVVNGGNCDWPDVNWVHYVHAAYERAPDDGASRLRAARLRVARKRSLAAERRALLRARIVIANSQRTRQHLIDLVGVEPQRIHVVYYGIDPDIFRPPRPGERDAIRRELGWPIHRPAVLFIGALGDRRKGFDTLFDAWRQLCRDTTWPADLLVVGQGAETRLWRQRIAEANLSDRIRMLGFRDDVPRLLRAADLLVSPTRYEAYGLAVHEALCCGLPAIVSASAGVAERYPPELRDLLLPDPNDAAALAQHLLHWQAGALSTARVVRQLAERLGGESWEDMSRAIVSAADARKPAPPVAAVLSGSTP